MSNLRERAEAVAGVHYSNEEDCWYSCPLSPEGCCNDQAPKDKCTCGYNQRVEAILAFAQAVQEEEREALVAMIQDDKGYPRQPQYSALNGWSFIVEAIRARGGKP